MKLFISYSRDDKAWVYELWRALRDEAHHDAWIDRRIVPATDWWESILENIETCDVFLYVMTPKSVESIYCTAEMEYAVALNKPILPLMLKTATVPAILSGKRVQYETITDELNMDRVLFRVERALGQIRDNAARYQPKRAARPAEPEPKSGVSEHIYETFASAEEALAERNVSLAESLFQKVIKADPQGLGMAAAQRLGEVRFENDRSAAYAQVVRMAANPATITGARAAWNAYLNRFGAGYDPELLAARLNPPPPASIAKPSVQVPPTPSQPVYSPPPAQPAQAPVRLTDRRYGDNRTAPTPALRQPPRNLRPARPKWLIWLPGIAGVGVLGFIGIVLVMVLNSGGDDPGTQVAFRASVTPRPASATPRASVTSSPAVATSIATLTNWTPRIETFNDVPMAYVPAGCFRMGSEVVDDEQPVHEVCLDAFWIDVTEVTQGDFERLGGTKANENGFDGDRRPVERITWFEARDFCEARGARLPTEAEWEYAARGPQGYAYPWGDDFVAENVVYSANSNDQTAEVGSRPGGVSWVGALDMSGNVWEWVSTIYGLDDGDYNFSESGERVYAYPYSATDGREQDSEDGTFVRVLRGGSWHNLEDVLRAANRLGGNPDYGSNSLGFRCARS